MKSELVKEWKRVLKPCNVFGYLIFILMGIIVLSLAVNGLDCPENSICSHYAGVSWHEMNDVVDITPNVQECMTRIDGLCWIPPNLVDDNGGVVVNWFELKDESFSNNRALSINSFIWRQKIVRSLFS